MTNGEVCHVLQVDPSRSTFKAKYDPSCTSKQIAIGDTAGLPSAWAALSR
jgi:hypothetical protein